MNSLNRRMMKEVYDALEGCDLLLLIFDVTQKFSPTDHYVLDLAKRTNVPIVLLLNKIDAIAKERLLPLIAQYKELHDFSEVIPISALKQSGLDELLNTCIKLLPEGPRYFAKDQVTDQPERFLAAELIREQVLLHTSQEVPHATAVVIEQYEEGARLTRIAAAIYVEREGQKAIVIGKQGAALKRIGTAARLQIERLLNTKVFLELFVKVEPNWRESRRFVEEIDWRRQLENLSLPVSTEEEDEGSEPKEPNGGEEV
jgi:GTP-binding protein Era